MLLLRIISYAGSYIPAFQNMWYTGPWWKYFSFAVIFYNISITGYPNAIEAKGPLKLNLLSYKSSLLLPTSTAVMEKSFFIEDEEIIDITNTKTTTREDAVLLAEWKPNITELLQHDNVYQNPELSLAQLPKQLQTNPSVESRVINQGLQLNFNDFINQYCIEAEMQKFNKGSQKTQTLFGIAHDCGFNSKATFNLALKKLTDLSPMEWLKKNA